MKSEQTWHANQNVKGAMCKQCVHLRDEFTKSLGKEFLATGCICQTGEGLDATSKVGLRQGLTILVKKCVKGLAMTSSAHVCFLLAPLSPKMLSPGPSQSLEPPLRAACRDLPCPRPLCSQKAGSTLPSGPHRPGRKARPPFVGVGDFSIANAE